MYWEYYFTIENVLVTCRIFVSILSIIRERYKNVAELIINILSVSYTHLTLPTNSLV